MSGNRLQETPREKRCPAGNGESLTVRVRHRSGLPSEDTPATISDISRSGVKLSIKGCLLIGEDLSLTLDVFDSNPPFSFPAKVCWTQPVDDTTWRVGCSFDPPLSDATLSSLASGGHLQRRQDYREPLSLDAKVRWEATSQSIPVQMVDVSAGGFCFRSDQNGKDSPRLVLQLDSDADAPLLLRAKVLWKRNTDDGCLYGCEFATREGRAAFDTHLRSAVSVEQAGTEADPHGQSLRLALLTIIFIGSLLALLLVR